MTSWINTRLELCSEAIESKGSKLTRIKTEYMECKFNDKRQRNKELGTIIGEKVAQRDRFRLLGSLLHDNGEIERDVT